MSLKERILAAAEASTDVQRATLHDQLRGAGDRLLAEAQRLPSSRDAALTLLAADALMTFACEALAEVDPGRLAARP